ncbi:ATP-binding cassette domain-containing protein [Xinfangfangia sp. D13-10-4-6]|nr:ATP-binding cassette domain-containing protein [Pseudogemmobacter hezensis]
MRRTPTVLQMESTECGAAVLAILCGHWGLWKTLEELRLLCNVSRDGASAAGIARAARGLGFEVRASRTEPAELSRLRHPAILHWGMDHFIVLEGIRGGKAWINDPATGPRSISLRELDEGFTGILLELTPGPGFAKGGRAPSLWSALRQRLVGQRGTIGFSVMLALALIIPGLMVPVFTQIFIDQVLIARHDSWLVPLLLAMLAAALVMAALTWLQREVMLRLETALVLRGALGFARHVLHLPLSYFAQRHAGEVASRVMVNDRVGQLISTQLGLLLLSGITASAYLMAMLVYAPLLTLPVVVAALLNLGAFLWVSRGLTDANRRLAGAMTGQAGFAKLGLQMIEAWAARGQQDLFRSRLAARNAQYVNLQQEVAAPQLWLAALPALSATLTAGTVLLLGGMQVIDGAITIGTLIAFQALMMAFFAPFGQLIQLGGGIMDGLAIMRLLDDTLDHPLAAEFTNSPAQPARAAGKLSGAISLQGVSFGHSAHQPVLQDISFTLYPGERLGIVGSSGSGKSTLGQLIAGHIQPQAGEIRFDGQPLAEIARDTFRASLASVDQHTAIFQASIRQNVTLWDSSQPEERVIAACRAAGLHDDILRRPGGYGAMLNEGGTTLSGGQRARLEIARALLREPRILILDEASAALDAETEARVMRGISGLGLTTIVIAHRWSALRHVDRVLVLEKGRIVQEGTPDALIAAPGPFRHLMEHDA